MMFLLDLIIDSNHAFTEEPQSNEYILYDDPHDVLGDIYKQDRNTIKTSIITSNLSFAAIQCQRPCHNQSVLSLSSVELELRACLWCKVLQGFPPWFYQHR